MSALPKAIQAQLDQAEALQAQMTTEPAPDNGNPEPEVALEQPNLQLVSQEPQNDALVTQPVATDDKWEQRFKVIEGKYKAEIPRLYDQNRQLSEQLENAIKALEAAKKPEPQQDAKLVTDADVDAYGAELVDMVRRAAREEFNSLSKAFSAELEKRFGAVTEQVQRAESQVVRSETDKFWDKVLGAHADFDVINADQRWFAFLDGQIPGTRLTRRQVAEDAIARLDAVVLSEQLKLFKDATSASQPATPTKPKPNLNAQVAPSSSRASTPVQDVGKRTWTGAEYAAALDHRNLQRIPREDYDRQVAEAELALSEGRVQF